MPDLADYVDDATLRRLIETAKLEDLGPDGVDLTSACFVDARATGSAVFEPREPGYLAGLALLPIACEVYGGRVSADLFQQDGSCVDFVEDTIMPIARITGPTRDILAIERVALNLMAHLSGIATLTAEYVKRCEGTKATIYDTRKTLPGLRGLQKYAVACGGGGTHRMGLYDAVLIKDNHLAGTTLGQLTDKLKALVDHTRQTAPEAKFIMVEVDTHQQLAQVLKAPIDIALLDNMTPSELAKAVEMRDKLAPNIKLEASGGINLKTVGAIAKSGVDRISVGALTHSVMSLDIGLDISRKTLTVPDPENKPESDSHDILLHLYQDKDYTTMHALTHALKRNEEQVSASLNHLKDQGCIFDEDTDEGVRLRSIGLGAWVDILESETGWPFQRFEVYQSTASTQDICKRYAQEQGEAALGTVVIADEQTAGRGRRGNTWQAPAGSALLFSFVGHPALSPERYAHTIAHDLFKGLQQYAVRNGQLSLKWPNDIYLEGKKLAGILIERINGMPIIGIGINTHLSPEQFPPELRDTATSLHGQPHLGDRAFLLADLLSALGMSAVCYRTEIPYDTRWTEIQQTWRDNCHMLGRRYTFACDGVEYTGEVLDLDPDHGLIVRRDTGEIITLPAATTSVVK